jgi:thiosulfate/3-mercaptopyruvate sulfurtransferase
MLPQLVDPGELAAWLDDPRLRVLDATVFLSRSIGARAYSPHTGRYRYENAHIAGAGFVDLIVDLADPRSRFVFALPSPDRFAMALGMRGVGPGTHVVVYAHNAPMWATRLWWLLRSFGSDDVSVLDGGLAGWQAPGYAVTDEWPRHAPVVFDAHPRPERLATRDDVEAITRGDAAACLINALPEPVFRGDEPWSDRRAGRIPHSVSASAARLIDPDTFRFRSLLELAEVFDAVGARDHEEVVAYCGNEIAATVDVFALSLLGRDDVRLYDGSLAEWAADRDLPLAVGYGRRSDATVSTG